MKALAAVFTAAGAQRRGIAVPQGFIDLKVLTFYSKRLRVSLDTWHKAHTYQNRWEQVQELNVVESYLSVPLQLNLPKHCLHPTFSHRFAVAGDII